MLLACFSFRSLSFPCRNMILPAKDHTLIIFRGSFCLLFGLWNGIIVNSMVYRVLEKLSLERYLLIGIARN